MIEVNVNVRLSASPELAEMLAGLFSGKAITADADKKATTRTRTTVKEPEKVVAAAEETVNETEKVVAAAEKAPEEEKPMTYEALRKVVMEHSTKGNDQRAEVKKLLADYKATRVEDVPEDKRNAFAEEIKKLQK